MPRPDLTGEGKGNPGSVRGAMGENKGFIRLSGGDPWPQ